MGISRNGHAKPSSLRLLEELPGIGDVVWAAVTRLAGARAPTTVLFTAAEERAGTSVLAAATAIGLAQHQRVPVCLVETNVRRPALAGYLGLDGRGLSDVLDHRAELDACLQETPDVPGLAVLTAGSARAPVPGEFTTERMNEVLARLAERGHFVVLDAAPVLERVESRLLLRRADAALLVLRARATRLLDAERAHQILVESGTPVLGSIFNDYRTESLLGGGLAAANRLFEKAVRAERPRAVPAPAIDREELVDAWDDEPPLLRGDLAAILERPLPTNGEPLEPGTEAAYRRQIDLLERRIVKLTLRLEQTEADLKRIAAMKNIDLGLASIYRSVQGLSLEDEARAMKKSLLKKIFQANMELKTAMARIS